jgi:hypothetical protein
LKARVWWSRGRRRLAGAGTHLGNRWSRQRQRRRRRRKNRRLGLGFECVRPGSSRLRESLHSWRRRLRRCRWGWGCDARRSGPDLDCHHRCSGRLGNEIVWSDRVRRCGRGLPCGLRCRCGRLRLSDYCGVRGRRRRRSSDRRLIPSACRRLKSSSRRMVHGRDSRRLGRSRFRSFRRQAGRLQQRRDRARKRRAARRIAAQVPEDESPMQQREHDQQPDDGHVDAVRHGDTGHASERRGTVGNRLYRRWRARRRMHPARLAHGGVEGRRA